MQGRSCEVQWLGTAEDQRVELERKTAVLMNGGKVTAYGMTVTTSDVMECVRKFQPDFDTLVCKMALGCELAADQVKLATLAYSRGLVFGLLKLNERWETYDDLIVAAGIENNRSVKLTTGITITGQCDNGGKPYFLASTNTNGRTLLAEGESESEAFHNIIEVIGNYLVARSGGKAL